MTEPAQPELDLSTCDREPIHIPGAIQPHGALLALRGDDQTVAQVSENIGDYLGRDAESVLGLRIAELFDADSAGEIARALAADGTDRAPLGLRAGGVAFDGLVHRHDGIAVLELERASAVDPSDRPMRRALAIVQRAASIDELCAEVVRGVKQLTGFDRVMLYRFDPAGHGAVVAEAVEPELTPYLGLHYPASDIPQQARSLYLKNWLRVIPDARYAPARIVPSLHPETARPLDLSFAVLRSVSPIHLEYLANMGVRASMSVSLIVRDRLWGLITCLHHRAPRQLPHQQRWACEVIGRLASIQLTALQERDAAAQRRARRRLVDDLVRAIAGVPATEDLLAGLFDRPAELLALVEAEGAATVTASGIRTCGCTPPPEVLEELARRLARDDDGIVASSHLAGELALADDVKGLASGVLLISLPGRPTRHLLWVRPEVVQTVEWGGDPRKPVEVGEHARLHPRRSFALWKEEVRDRSLPWSSADLEAAESLRRELVELDLARQVARAQQAIRARDDMVAVVSHDLRSPIGVIEMAAESIDTDDPSTAVAIERILRATDRMTRLIHDVLDLATLEAGRFTLRRRSISSAAVIEETLALLRPHADAKQIEILLDLADLSQVDADRDRVFQVLSNLVSNAIKFTPEHGEIHIHTERRGGELVFEIADTGPGIPPDRMAGGRDPLLRAAGRARRRRRRRHRRVQRGRALARDGAGDVDGAARPRSRRRAARQRVRPDRAVLRG